VLEKLELPSAIFTMPMELRSKSKQSEFLEAMGRIVMEDNSLLFREETETGQYLVSGLGELHLEVVKDKLIEEGIDAKLGNLKIGYRETLNQPSKKLLKLRTDFKTGSFEEFELELEIVPRRNEDGSIEDAVTVVFDFPKVDAFDANWREFLLKKQISKTGRKGGEDETKDSVALAKSANIKKSIRNPTPIEPLTVESDEAEPE
jgi:translation elongation factor EF-G